MYYKNRFRILKGGLISLVVASNLYGAPTGGTVVSGTATISQNGNTTNINQSSNKAIINWQDFSIKSNETVNFNQPNSNSITLNRVIGNEKSIIDGALNANGQVWLINSNGVLFGKNAKVNTAGIVASTKDISNEDFNNGNYNFKGNSNASIINEGEIKSLANTHATFIANSVTNKGVIEVHKGTINLIGASDVTLTLNENQNLSLKVNKGVLDALVDNQNLIVANGGQIYLTTNAKDELLKGVVNNSGIIEVNSLDELTQSEVILFAHGGTANISGTINAKGGFVETSGKNLNVTNNSKIQAKKWLIDPVNVTIDNSNGTVGNEKVGASVIQTTLNNGTDVTIQADNDITVNETISYNQNELTLNAGNNININKDINVTGGGLSLVYAQASGNTTGDYKVNAKVNLANGTTFKTKKGSDGEINWTVVTANDFYTTLNANKSGNYVLGKDITLSGTNNWMAIGDSGNSFTGKFDGLGHTISNLNIDKSSVNYQGLFGYTNSALIRNIGLVDVNIKGNYYVGGLVGYNDNSTIKNSYVTGAVDGKGNY
ncbi:two-partner secretion domain-containing protein, partial [Aliarcobacter cryaerophilus]|uniref:two-partner secretion domain-containing protein n=1 Tax=Aliarcobacter cryaerophilus TaxID=28198 RepID=UPI000AC26460